MNEMFVVFPAAVSLLHLIIRSFLSQSIGEIFRRLCSYKGVEIIEGYLMPDHAHMLVSIPPKISVSSFMGT